MILIPIFLILGTFLKPSNPTSLKIFCQSNDTMEGAYDSIFAEYSGRVNLIVPFTMSQILTLSTPWNETHSITYSQVCELDSDQLFSHGLLDPDTIDNAYKRVEAKIWSCLNPGPKNSTNLMPPSSPTTTTTTTTTLPTTESLTESYDHDLNSPDTDSIIPPPDVDVHSQTIPGYINLATIRHNKDILNEVSRNLRYLDDEDEDAHLPESYKPARSRSYKAKIQRFIASKVKGNNNGASNHKMTSADFALGSEYLRKRIYILENRYLKLIYLFRVSMNSVVKGHYCIKVIELKHVIRCTHYSMSSIQSSPYKRSILKMVSDIMDLDSKIDDDTELYDQYTIGALT